MFKNLLLLIFLFSAVTTFGQTTEVNTIQPTIMLVPRIQEGEDIRTILDQDESLRVVISKLSEAFNERGFAPIDFLAKLKNYQENNLINATNQEDILAEIVELSGADIYVAVDMIYSESSSGNSVTIILNGYDSYTAASLANKTETSPKMYAEFLPLAGKAIEKITEGFLVLLQSQFTQIVEDGRAVYVEFSLSPNASVDFDTEMDVSGLPLSDTVEEWMEENAYKNNYHIAGVTSKKLIYDQVRIPVRDPKNNRNYTPNKFALEIYKFIKSLNLSPDKFIKGGKIMITIE